MKIIKEFLLAAMASPPLFFLVTFLASFVVIWMVFSLRPSWAWKNTGRVIFCTLAATLLAGFGWLTVKYLFLPQFLDHVEPLVPEVSWYYLEGHPLYTSLDAVECYNVPYGPNLYLFTALFQKLLGPTLFSAKLPTALAGDAALIFLFLALRKRAAASLALIGTGACAALFLGTGSIVVRDRADSLLGLFTAIGLWAAVAGSPASPFILGAALGVAVNLKVHAFLYFIPLAAVGWRSGLRMKQVGLTLGCAAVTAALPFTLFRGISLENYLVFLKAVAGHGLDLAEFGLILGWFIVLMTPLGLAIWLANKQDPASTRAALRANTILLGCIVLTFLLMAVPASKYGAGQHHLMPWMISLPFLVLQLHRDGLRLSLDTTRRAMAVCALLAAGMLGSYGTAFNTLLITSSRINGLGLQAAPIAADLREILRTYRKDYIVLMGAVDGPNYRFAYFRPWLIFDGQPIGLDPAALMDFKRAGFATPDVFQLATARGKNPAGAKGILWLLPKDAPPFSLGTAYPPYDLLYDEHFRREFTRRFHRIGASNYYDLYAEPSPPTAALGTR